MCNHGLDWDVVRQSCGFQYSNQTWPHVGDQEIILFRAATANADPINAIRRRAYGLTRGKNNGAMSFLISFRFANTDGPRNPSFDRLENDVGPAAPLNCDFGDTKAKEAPIISAAQIRRGPP